MRLFKHGSLRLRLMLVVSCTALGIWIISTAVAWMQVYKEVNKVFDTQQILFAQRLATSDLRTMLIDHHSPRLDKRQRYDIKRALRKAQFDDDALAFAVFNRRGEMVLGDGNNGDNFIYTQRNGFANGRISNDDGDLWRIFWLPIADGKLVVAVGQELDYRDDLVEDMVLSQMWIWFASLPLLLGMIIWVINHELQTLKRVGEQVQLRTPEEVETLSTDVPKEILPLVDSLNHFFARTSDMLLRERRFTSDAAHELRSPLAALKIQAEVAQLAKENVAMRDKALSNLMMGIDRATQLIEQLLTLSRLDNLTALEGVEPIYWEKLLASLVGDLYFSAQKRQIELILEQESVPTLRQGQPLLLSLMVRNVIDNAIRYCPEGSTVHIRLTQQALVIEDNGGGVANEDLAKLGQRFYRPAGQNEKGSGLGLSIVYRIAQLHHYRVALTNNQQGLKVAIHFD